MSLKNEGLGELRCTKMFWYKTLFFRVIHRLDKEKLSTGLIHRVNLSQNTENRASFGTKQGVLVQVWDKIGTGLVHLSY